jgi:hypothetical protein
MTTCALLATGTGGTGLLVNAILDCLQLLLQLRLLV